MSFDVNTVLKFLQEFPIPHGCDYNQDVNKIQKKGLCVYTVDKIEKGKAELKGNKCGKNLNKDGYVRADLVKFFKAWLNFFLEKGIIDKEKHKEGLRIVNLLEAL